MGNTETLENFDLGHEANPNNGGKDALQNCIDIHPRSRGDSGVTKYGKPNQGRSFNFAGSSKMRGDNEKIMQGKVDYGNIT